MKAETIIYWLVSALNPSRRNRIPVEEKIQAISLYSQGLSYRQVARILGIVQKGPRRLVVSYPHSINGLFVTPWLSDLL